MISRMAFDFTNVTAPFRMQPGLRRLAPGALQLTPTAPGDRALREKLAVLMSWPEQALLASAGFDATPALQALSAQAAQEHPGAWASEGAGHGRAIRLGCSVAQGEVQREPTSPPEIAACLQALPAPWRLTALLCLAFA